MNSSNQNQESFFPYPKHSSDNEDSADDLHPLSDDEFYQINYNQFNDNEYFPKIQTLALNERETTIIASFLKKKGEKRRTWKKRYFVLKPNRLAYYKDDKEYEILNIIDIHRIHAIAPLDLPKRPFSFGISTKERIYYLQADSKDQMDLWLKHLNLLSAPLLSPDKDAATDASVLTVPSIPSSSGIPSASEVSPLGTPLPQIPESTPIPSLTLNTVTENSDPSNTNNVGSYTTDTINNNLIANTNNNAITMGENHTSGLKTNSTVNHHVTFTMKNNIDINSTSPSSSNTRDLPSSNAETPSAPELNSVIEKSHNNNNGHLKNNSSNSATETNSATPIPIPRPLLTSQLAEVRIGSSPLANSWGTNATDSDDDTPTTPTPGTPGSDLVLAQGYLSKLKTGLGGVKTWKKYWVVLRHHNLITYANQSEYEVRRLIPIKSILDIIEIDPVTPRKDHHSYCFRLVLSKRSWILSAESAEVLAMWLKALRDAQAAYLNVE